MGEINTDRERKLCLKSKFNSADIFPSLQGIADIAGGELSRYQLLEVSDPTSLLVKGQSQDSFYQDCQELTRLQTV